MWLFFIGLMIASMVVGSILNAKIDQEYNTTRMSIENYRQKILQVFDYLQVISKTGGVNG